MSFPTEIPEKSEPRAVEEIASEVVRIELERILRSRHFRSSKRSIQFLRYVVEQKLEGNESLIKERLIGIEVFGRKANYATGEDPVVRVQAGEVRRRLNLYHAEFSDSIEIAIELPTGSYVPAFRRCNIEASERGNASFAKSEPTEATNLEIDYPTPVIRAESMVQEQANYLHKVLDRTINIEFPLPSKRPSRFRRIGFVLAVLVLIALGAGGSYWWYRSNQASTGFTKFWGPVTNSSKPTVISLGKPFVYAPSARLYDEYEKDHPGAFSSPVDRHNRYLPLNRELPMQWSDMNPVSNSGPAVGGVRAAMQLSSVLGRMRKSFIVRFGDEGSFLELRDSPAIIVGGLNNRWTNEIDRDLHFGIRDNNSYQYVVEAGTNRTWKAESTPHGVTDYGLVTRQLIGPTGQFLVKVAGMSDSGTEAASEMITNPDILQDAIQSLPADWEHKNVQLLVETNIIGGKAGPPKLISTYVW